MPPRKKIVKKGDIAQAVPIEGPVATGSGITTGLEIWRYGEKFVLVDKTDDERYASDLLTWNTGAGLNAADIHRIKDATR
jgi:hypothetical protein